MIMRRYQTRPEVLEFVRSVGETATKGKSSPLLGEKKQIPVEELVREMEQGTRFGRESYRIAEIMYDSFANVAKEVGGSYSGAKVLTGFFLGAKKHADSCKAKIYFLDTPESPSNNCI